MKVDGVEIPTKAVDAALQRMAGTPFKARTIAEAMMDHMPVRSHFVIMRAADRLLEREKRAGRIRYADGYWGAVPADEKPAVVKRY